ncbi:MAG: tetratricopeptide repeat protein [Candidatus Brocadia sp.]|nr:tetratricopeptide repeat protein [Candidatus Brocadia sp.]
MVVIIMRWKLYQKLLASLVVFLIAIVSGAYGNDRKLKLVVFPFKNNWDSKCSIQGIEDIMRSELIRSGYCTVAEQERTYEFMKEAVLYNFIKIDDVNVETALSKANIVDLFAKVDLKVTIRSAERLKADFAIKGTLNHFGDKFRTDIEVFNVRAKETLCALVGECESKEKIPEMIEQLSEQIVNVCRGANVQKEIDHIQSGYQQGSLTYEETSDKLKSLCSDIPGSLPVHCALFSHYLRHQKMRDSLIEEGEEIINLFNPDNDEDIRYVSFSGIDPFHELANVYSAMGRLDNAIEVYNRAIKIYPMNHIKYYKQLGALYKLEGKSELAINAFKQILSSNPADCETRLNLASVYEAKGDISSAIEQYQYCLKYTKDRKESSDVKEIIIRLQSKRGMKEK